MADTDNDDTILGAVADDTAVVPDVHPTQASRELAWSNDAETEEFDQRSWGHTWRNAGIVVGAAALVATGIGVFGLLARHSQSAQTTASTTSAPALTAAQPPAPATVTVTAPPPVTVTAEAPPEPKLEGVDAKFISFLRNNDVGSVYANVSNATAISNALLICTDMLHRTGFQNVADNLNLTPAQIAWFADTALANYCPQYGGDV
jgi:Protein of unknown function (DUF732)